MKKILLLTMSIGLTLFVAQSDAAGKTNKSNPKKKHLLAANVNTPKPVVVHARVYAIAELTKNIEYGFAKSTIRDNYYDKLDALAKLSQEKNFAIVLRGHADSIGTFKGNWKISQKRADAVKAYLVQKGVPDKNIVATAFGSTKPISSNKTAEGRQKNRRVEIKVDKIKE